MRASARDGWGRFGWTLVAAPNFDQNWPVRWQLGLRRGACQVSVADWQLGRVEVWSGRKFHTRYRPQTPAHGDASMGAWGRTGDAWMGTGMMIRSSWPLGSPDRGASWSVLAAHARSGIARVGGVKEAAGQATTCRELDVGAAFLVGRGGRWDMAM